MGDCISRLARSIRSGTDALKRTLTSRRHTAWRGDLWTEPIRPDRDRSQLLQDIVHYRKNKEKEGCKSEITVENLNWKWCVKSRQARSDQHKYVVNMLWLKVYFHAGAKNITSVEKRPFCLSHRKKPALRINGLLS